MYVDVAISNGSVAYGHRWQAYEELIYKDKTFRTRFDKENYISGGYAYQPDGKKYWVVDGALDEVKTFQKKVETDSSSRQTIEYCGQCGRKINKVYGFGLCASCVNVKAKGKSPKPSKKELRQLLENGMRPSEIATIYGRTQSTVYYWIKDYELK